MDRQPIDRRAFLRRAGLAAGGLAALGGGAAWALSGRAAELDPPVLLPATKSNRYSDLRMTLAMAPGTQQILAGQATTVWKYSATLAAGRAWQVQQDPNSYLGPTIRVARGNRLQIRMQNDLPEPTITHWHGLDVPETQDGHPRFATAPGNYFDYDFVVNERAGMYWYHPHPDMRTGPQVASGLAGVILVTDEYEQKLGLPKEDYEQVMVIQDRSFDASNQFTYNFGPLPGYLGNTVLVNGQTNFVKPCKTRAYRLRILNGSNARTYKLAWSDGSPVIVMGTDGGFLPAPVSKPYVMLSPGERLDVWADMTGKTVGSNIVLKSLAWTPGGVGGGGNPPNGTAMDIATFYIAQADVEPLTLPAGFAGYETLNPADAVNLTSPRTFPITYILQSGQPRFLINGALFDMNTTLPVEEVPRNTVEVWQVTNTAATAMPHPFHFHGRHFQILERVAPTGGALLTAYNTVKDGLLNTGWKDTFLIMPGETVKVLTRTTNHPGLFVMHCHLLEHEDMGMMRNLRVMP